MNLRCESVTNCTCKKESHTCKRIVITGGPGGGKTAVLEIARKNFCQHIQILPESASILFSGGFPRGTSNIAKKASQRAIFHIQKELERIVEEEGNSAIALCDRGTIDGLAYWTDEEELFWKEVGTTKSDELKRYAAVIHLRTPPLEQGYNHQNPVRVESAAQAASIDLKIEEAWKDHPHRYFVTSENEFLEKVESAIQIIKSYLPECCQGHEIKELQK